MPWACGQWRIFQMYRGTSRCSTPQAVAHSTPSTRRLFPTFLSIQWVRSTLQGAQIYEICAVYWTRFSVQLATRRSTARHLFPSSPGKNHLPERSCEYPFCRELADSRTRPINTVAPYKVNEASAASIIAQLLYLEAENPELPISMYINSPGGEVMSGMGIYDTVSLC